MKTFVQLRIISVYDTQSWREKVFCMAIILFPSDIFMTELVVEIFIKI